MAAKKLDKALYGPSVAEVALGAVLGLLVGVVVAAIFLVFKPVATVKEMPKQVSRTTVYFLPGSTAGARGWEDKQKQFLAGASIAVSEADLNAWAVAADAPAPDAKAGKAAPKPDEKAKPGAKAAAAADGAGESGERNAKKPSAILIPGDRRIIIGGGFFIFSRS